jgi:predicted DNA-binding antitoxin AbrB/MazE fold protein
MSYLGEVKNGVIVLEEEVPLTEGAKVRVEFIETADLPTLAERLKDFIGKAEGLPPDLAKNHDHYLHGQPKK